MSVLALRAELVKLAHLGITTNLDGLGADDVRAMREAISARLFDDARPTLQRVATGARLLPTGLVARVGENVFGATLCAQVAGLLAPPFALDLALRMSDPFLAAVSAAIDPRSAGEVVRRIPAPRIVAVAHVLLARGEYVTLARFVDYLEPATIAAVIDSDIDIDRRHYSLHDRSSRSLPRRQCPRRALATARIGRVSLTLPCSLIDGLSLSSFVSRSTTRPDGSITRARTTGRLGFVGRSHPAISIVSSNASSASSVPAAALAPGLHAPRSGRAWPR